MRKTGGYMKNSLKIKHIWVTSIILSALVLVFFIVNLVLELNGIILPYKAITVFTLIFVIAILVAWVSGDIRANKYRKKTNCGLDLYLVKLNNQFGIFARHF